MLLDICAGRLSRSSAGVKVGEKRIEASREGGRVGDGEGAATSDEVEGLAKLVVVGTEEHGDAVDRSLGGVVNAVAEAAADVGDAGVAVNGRKETEGVDDEAVDARGRVGIGAGEAQGRTGEAGLNGGEVRLVDLVRSEDELQVGVDVEIGDQQRLVFWPRATSNQHRSGVAFSEGGNDGERPRGMADVDHAIEAGVARDGDVRQTDAGEELARGLVLHKEVIETAERIAIRSADGAEEELTGTENAGHKVGGDASAPQLIERVQPKLVLDKEGEGGADTVEETADAAWEVEREVAYDIGAGVVTADVVARGGEEREDDFVVGVVLANGLKQGPPLLEFTERSGVKPDVARTGDYLLTQNVINAPPPVDHLARLPIKRRSGVDGRCVEADSRRVEGAHQPSISMAR